MFGVSFYIDINEVYKYLENSSSLTLASLRTDFNVPILISLCIGTTVPTLPSGVSFDNLT